MVDRLLASPRYGERWARHWLDVVRFAETNGYERDGAKPNAWRYRDYVIDALNHDKPYDRFLTEQLAGDEIEGSDASAQIATTFLRLGTWDDEPAEPKVDRYDQLDDVLGTTATAFLGITLRCARCHDHKFEPFSQADYYRMLAVFEPLKRPQNDRADLDRPVGTEAELAAYQARSARADAEFAATWGRIEGLVKPEIDRLLAPAETSKDGKPPAKRTSLPPIAVAAFRTEPSKRTPAQRNLVKEFAEKLAAEVREIAPAEVKAALRPLEDEARRDQGRAPGTSSRLHLVRGGAEGAGHSRAQARQPGPARRRRRAGLPAVLAAQAAGPAQAHRQVVRSPALAGAVADQPGKPAGGAGARQPALAVPFRPGTGRLVQRSGSDGRRAHSSRAARLAGRRSRWPRAGGSSRCTGMIVLSQTYQRSSAFQPDAAKVDPDNTLLWRHRQRRLEAEVDPRLDPGRQRAVEHPDGRPRLLSDSSHRPCSRASRNRARAGASPTSASKRGAASTSSPSAAWECRRSSCSTRPTPRAVASRGSSQPPGRRRWHS